MLLVTQLNANLTADGLQFKFRKDGEGNYGFLGADGSLIPFRNAPINFKEMGFSVAASTGKVYPVIIDENGSLLVGSSYGTVEGTYFSVNYQKIIIKKSGTYTLYSGSNGETKSYSINETISLSADVPSIIIAVN